MFQGGSEDVSLLGSYTAETGALLSSHPGLFASYTDCLTSSPLLMVQTLNSEFLAAVPDSALLLRTVLAAGEGGVAERVAELDPECTTPVMIDLIKEQGNRAALQVIRLQVRTCSVPPTCTYPLTTPSTGHGYGGDSLAAV